MLIRQSIVLIVDIQKFIDSQFGIHSGELSLGPDNAIWDDGEWVSWAEINAYIDADEKNVMHGGEKWKDPVASNERLQTMLDALVKTAKEYKTCTGRYLPVWGELGELFAEIKYGIKRHKPMTQGSDGRLGDDFIEIKTISPEKGSTRVQVKRSGNFNRLVIVKIDPNFAFTSKIFARKRLPKGEGGCHFRVSWDSPAGQDA